MTAFWALVVLAALAAVLDWAAVWSGSPRARAVERLAKPATLLALLAAAVVAPLDHTDWSGVVRPMLLAALAASLAGDIFLLPGGRFTAGLVSFLLGHVAYLAAFLLVPGSMPWLGVGIGAAVVLVLTVGRLLVRAARRSGMGAPVAAYLVAICAMAVAATHTGIPLAVVGAWLFVASDSMLGWGRFALAPAASGTGTGSGTGNAQERPDRRLSLAVITTYHAGQLLLVLALVG